MEEKKSHCVSCGDPDYGDCLTPDGLCFGCDVEDTRFKVTSENTAEMLERFAYAASMTRGGRNVS